MIDEEKTRDIDGNSDEEIKRKIGENARKRLEIVNKYKKETDGTKKDGDER